MDVVEAIQREGGVVRAAMLVRHVSRRDVQRALRDERIVRVKRGWYALPDDDARAAAAAVGGVLGLLSAARYWDWKVKSEPVRPQVLVERGRNVSCRHGAEVRWARLGREHDGIATDRVRTVIDCGRLLPFDEALAVADSALRSQTVTRTELLLAAQRSPRTGRRRSIEVIEAADARAANPFESVLRAIVMQIPDAQFVPQQWIAEIGRPDLVDRQHRVILEADSFEFHSSRDALRRDIERYNAFVIEGWTVLRFGWEHVMRDPEYVTNCVLGAMRTERRSVRRDRGVAAA